jgi:hypothetical protein
VKKLVVLLVLLVYTAASIGATVHLHYCMDKFVGGSLWHDEKDNECRNCGMTEKKGGCCKEEHKQIKVENDHQKSSAAKYVQLISAPALVTPFATYIFKATSLTYFTALSNAPPHIPKRLHLLNCVFLI